MLVRTGCGTGRCFDFVPITVAVSICRHFGYIRLIVATSTVVGFATNRRTGGFYISCPLGFVIVSELINGLCFSRKFSITYRTVNYAIVASISGTICINLVLNNCRCIGMSVCTSNFIGVCSLGITSSATIVINSSFCTRCICLFVCVTDYLSCEGVFLWQTIFKGFLSLFSTSRTTLIVYRRRSASCLTL